MADRLSVRARGTLLATLVSGTALLVGAVLLLLTLDHSLHASGDDLARSRVRDLGALARTGALPTSLDGIGGEGVGQVFTRDGTVLAASPNITGDPPITSPAAGGCPRGGGRSGPARPGWPPSSWLWRWLRAR